MKERCHICERKLAKDGSCKICKATEDEVLKIVFHANHIANALAAPFVNLLVTNKRFLVFEDMAGTGSMVGQSQGGLIGGLIGGAADKMVAKTLGSNGSLKMATEFSSITDVSYEDAKKKGLLVVVTLDNGKAYKFKVNYATNDATKTGEDLYAMLNDARM